jgi:predicted permease
LVGYPLERGLTFYHDIQERVRGLPGVRSAALASHVPLGPSSSSTTLFREESSFPNIMFNRVEPGFFETMATPILRGRVLDDRDTVHSPPVIVVNETLARLLWPDGDALGRHVRIGRKDGPLAEIVGIARDIKALAMVFPPAPYMYIPYAQEVQGQMTLFVHTAGDPASMAPAVRAEVKALAPDLPVFDVRTMRSVFDAFGMMASRMAAQTMAGMGAIGLGLSMLGLYSVTIFMVSRRTKEIGIRMALGAARADILRDVLGSALKFVVLGAGLGLVGSLATTHYFAAYIGGVNPRDPGIFVGVPMLLLAVAFLAAWAPARRASMVDPVITLRNE